MVLFKGPVDIMPYCKRCLIANTAETAYSRHFLSTILEVYYKVSLIFLESYPKYAQIKNRTQCYVRFIITSEKIEL